MCNFKAKGTINSALQVSTHDGTVERIFLIFESMNRLHIILLLLLPFSLFSQTPKRYFQQEVNYKINVALDDTKHSLSADIELEYINHSNDTLQNIWFHLWPNAYKDRNSALCKQLVNSGDPSLYFANEEERGYIDNLNFTVDNQETDW